MISMENTAVSCTVAKGHLRRQRMMNVMKIELEFENRNENDLTYRKGL